MRRPCRSISWLAGCLALLSPILPATGAAPPRVDVILWFDTEDYILPADDDACLRLARMLTERGIRATFKVVGEKARVLEQRGRRDTIAALKKHDIAYHADLHSVHPTPSEYLADCGWLDGVTEFCRREGGGAADVRRIFGVKTLGCYGQPGSSWAPQAVAALPQLGVAPHGVPCYVDEGDHVGLDGRPFWYAGALTIYDMGRNCTRMDLHDPCAVQPAQQKVAAIVQRLANEEKGGLISIYYHPCEWVHREFWDGVNLRRGANPPRERWQLPPQRSAAETEGAFRRFGQYVDFIRALPNVRFVTSSDLPLLYPDRVRSAGVTEKNLAELAARLGSDRNGGLDFQTIGNQAYSLADQFELLLLAVGQWVQDRQPRFPLVAHGLLGPDHPPPASPPLSLDGAAFRAAVLDALAFVQTERRVPARVFVGAEAVAPGDFLAGLATACDFHSRYGKLPLAESVRFPANREILPARRVAKDTPGLFGGWVIHKEGFRAPRILEQARLQAWTLKPALRQD